MHVIITGGSSGIGLALAEHYLRRGDHVTIIGRAPARLADAVKHLTRQSPQASTRLRAESADVCEGLRLRAVIEAACEAFGSCDTLITCAGVVSPAAFERMEAGEFDGQVGTNLTGTANAIRSVYPSMISRRTGRIMLVSSGAALIGIPGYTAYCASKAALIGFAEALRMEAEPHGVAVSICYPPDTETPQLAAELLLRGEDAAAIMGAVRPWPAAKVAARIAQGIERGVRHLHFGPSLTLLARFGPLAKPFLYWWFLRQQRRRSGPLGTVQPDAGSADSNSAS